MSSTESQCGDACAQLGPGQPAISAEHAKYVEDRMKEKDPKYKPGKFMESALLLNDIKLRLDARDPELFQQYIQAFTVTTGEIIQKDDTEEQFREKFKSYDEAQGIKNARKFLEDEPELLERFDLVFKSALEERARVAKQAPAAEA